MDIKKSMNILFLLPYKPRQTNSIKIKLFMLNQVKLINVLVLDIETVPGKKTYQDLNPEMQKLWDIKSRQIQSRLPEEEKKSPDESYEESAGIYAEFGKIVCISVGFFSYNKKGELNFRLKSFYDHDERKLLIEFSDLKNYTRHMVSQ